MGHDSKELCKSLQALLLWAPSLIVLTVSLDVKKIELELTVGSELRNCENREVALGSQSPASFFPRPYIYGTVRARRRVEMNQLRAVCTIF